MKKTVVIGVVLAMSTAFAIGGDAEPTVAPSAKTKPATTNNTSDLRNSDEQGQAELDAASFADQYASDIPPAQ